MKVSIITATWNSDKTIKEALNSVNDQSYEDIEHIIIDGRSDDSTIKIIKENGKRVKKLVSEVDKGIYDALNKGISLSSGDIIGFLHSDDFFANDSVIDNIVNEFVDKNVDFVYGDLEYVSKYNSTKTIRKWISGNYRKENLLNGWMPPHPTFYMKKEHYKSFGGFNIELKISADYDSMLRYLWKNDLKPSYLPQVLVKMRMGGDSNKNLTNILKKMTEDRNVMIANGIPTVRALIGKNISKIPQFINHLFT